VPLKFRKRQKRPLGAQFWAAFGWNGQNCGHAIYGDHLQFISYIVVLYLQY
jgi:hypothetical protein